MTREEFKKWKRHDYAGINDGSFTPELKGWYWFRTMHETTGATMLVHAEKLEDL